MAKKSARSRSPSATPKKKRSPREEALEVLARAEAECDTDDAFFEAVQQALAIDPDCVEAWIELGRGATNRVDAGDALERAVAAAERLYGGPLTADRDPWEDPAGQLVVLATLEWAMHLVNYGRRDPAIDLLRRLLTACPTDPVAARYTLAVALLEAGRGAEAQALCDQDAARQCHSLSLRALCAFAVGGDSAAARAAFRALRSANRHAADALLGDLDGDSVDVADFELAPGSKEEAVSSAEMFNRAWRSIPGAIAWLRERRLATRKSPHPAPVGPTDAAVERLESLPPTAGEPWEIGVNRMPQWIHEGKYDLVRPWHVTILDPASGICLDHDLRQREPTADYLFDRIVKAATRPLGGSAGKPAAVCLRPSPAAEALAQPLARAGVELRIVETLPHIDYATESLRTAIVREENLPSLAEMPGVDDGRIRRWFDAAARLYRQQPWILEGEEAIRVSSPRLSSGPWELRILGQAGMTRAVVLTETTEGGQDEPVDNPMAAFGLLFESHLKLEYDEPFALFPADLETFERLELVPAAPEAWPQGGFYRHGTAERSLLTWELDLFEALCTALPEFLQKVPFEADLPPFESTVETAGGPLPLVLEWPSQGCAT